MANVFIEQASLRHRRAMVLAFPHAVLEVLARISSERQDTQQARQRPKTTKRAQTQKTRMTERKLAVHTTETQFALILS